MSPAELEVERFDWSSPHRLELEGRWSGVRGVLFVRPTIVLVAGDEHRRLLAELEGKPWPAGEGGTWRAAFPYDGEPFEAEAAELTVAPGIVVELPPPGAAGVGVTAAATGARGILQRAAEHERSARALGEERAAREALEAERAQLVRESDRLRRERDVLLRDRDRLAAERDAAVRERDAAAVTRDRLARERERLVAERDALRRAGG